MYPIRILPPAEISYFSTDNKRDVHTFMHTLSFKVSLRLFFPGVFPAILSVTFITAVVIAVIVILVFVTGSGFHTVFPASVLLAFIGLIPLYLPEAVPHQQVPGNHLRPRSCPAETPAGVPPMAVM